METTQATQDTAQTMEGARTSGPRSPRAVAQAKQDAADVLELLAVLVARTGAAPERLYQQLVQESIAAGAQRAGIPEGAEVSFDADEIIDLRECLLESIRSWTYPDEYLPSIRALGHLGQLCAALERITEAEVAALKPVTEAHLADKEFAKRVRLQLWWARGRNSAAQHEAARAAENAAKAAGSAIASEIAAEMATSEKGG